MQFQRYCCGNHVSCILLALGGLECYFEKVLWIFFLFVVFLLLLRLKESWSCNLLEQLWLFIVEFFGGFGKFASLIRF